MDIHKEETKHKKLEALKAQNKRVITNKYINYPFLKLIKLMVLKEITGKQNKSILVIGFFPLLTLV